MNLHSNPNRPRTTRALLVALLAASGGLFAWTLWTERAAGADTPRLERRAESESGAAGASHGALQRPARSQLTPSTDLAPGTPTLTEPVRVTCRKQVGGNALAGVQLYRAEVPIAGPSDADGALLVVAPGTGALTLWAEGWVPLAVRGETLPTVASFERATASLELRFENFTPEHRVLRSVLQPHAQGPISVGPWMPPLVETGLDTWAAERVPPGTYDLYLWVVFPGGEPRPFSRAGFDVASSERTRLTIDLAAPRDPDEFESDN